ncbi:hypothetical protein NQZ79_g1609 [Umbelopsis isabellina]|nr:hypothetical protein NQZ79_g1609 [Umbelopsis isabellina]
MHVHKVKQKQYVQASALREKCRKAIFPYPAMPDFKKRMPYQLPENYSNRFFKDIADVGDELNKPAHGKTPPTPSPRNVQASRIYEAIKHAFPPMCSIFLEQSGFQNALETRGTRGCQYTWKWIEDHTIYKCDFRKILNTQPLENTVHIAVNQLTQTGYQAYIWETWTLNCRSNLTAPPSEIDPNDVQDPDTPGLSYGQRLYRPWTILSER